MTLLICGITLLAMFLFYRGVKTLRDTSVASREMLAMPATELRDAAGRVKIAGVARKLPGTALVDPIMRVPCVWFRVTSYQRAQSLAARYELKRIADGTDLMIIGEVHPTHDPRDGAATHRVADVGERATRVSFGSEGSAIDTVRGQRHRAITMLILTAALLSLGYGLEDLLTGASG